MGPTPLQIKVNALERLCKEKVGYEEELKEESAEVSKLQKKVAEEQDPEKLEDLQYTLKTAIKVRDETSRMLPKLKSKIKETLSDLKSYMKQNGETDEGRKAVEDAEAVLDASGKRGSVTA